jgi:hypothetical protein
VVDLTARRRVAGLALGAGLGIVVVARLLVPGAPPLYDGVVINEPYKWLDPPPGEEGGAQGVTGTAALENGASPLIALATAEQPPQAQVFAANGDLILPPGTTSLLLSITPIPPEGTPDAGPIAGNVYRISITNQDGVPVTAPPPPNGYVSVVMRGPGHVLEATIERFEAGTWHALRTEYAGYTSGFLSIVTEFGDFALVAPIAPATSSTTASGTSTATQRPSATPGTQTGTGGGSDPLLLILLGAGMIGVAGGAFLVYRSIMKPLPPPSRGGRRRRR